MNIYDELQTSLQEAVDIKQGKKAASRITRQEVADVKAIRAHRPPVGAGSPAKPPPKPENHQPPPP